MVGALGLHAAVPGSNPVLASGLDLFPVVPDSILPRFVNSQLVASFPLGFLIMFLLRTVPTIVITHTFCTSRDSRVSSVSVMLTNTGIFLRGLKLSG